MCFQPIIFWFFWSTVINIHHFLRKALGEQIESSETGECWGGFCFADKVQGQTQLSLIVRMAEAIWMGAKERPVRVVLQWEFVADPLTRERTMFSLNNLGNPLYH